MITLCQVQKNAFRDIFSYCSEEATCASLGACVRLLAARGVKSAGWAFGPRVKAPVGFRAAGGWRELSDLLSDVKNKTNSSLIFTLCVTHLTHTLSPPDDLHESKVFLCVVCNQQGVHSEFILRWWESSGIVLYSYQPVRMRRSTVAPSPGYYGIFASSNYLPDSWATPFCFTRTKESRSCFCVPSLSQRAICSNREYSVGRFLFLIQRHSW